MSETKSQLQGASVVVEADRFEVDLQALARRTGLDQKRPETPPAPPVAVAGIDAIHVETGGLSLQQILAVADSGKAVVRIPLFPQSFKIGPFSVDIEAGARVVLDLAVSAGGIIERKQTRGRLEPGLKLPLGVVVNGVYVDDNGNLIADVERLPDVNLSLLALRGLRVPESLHALLELIFNPKKDPLKDPSSSSPEKPAEKADKEQGWVDFGGIEVEATDVRARSGQLMLGAGVTVSSGDKTRLDITWLGGKLSVKGFVDVVEANIVQPSFTVARVSGSAHLDFRIAIDDGSFALALDDAHARIGSAHAVVGDSVVDVEDAGTTTPAKLKLERKAGQPLTFQADLAGVDGRLAGGRVVVDVGPKRVPLQLRPGHAQGSLTVSNRHHKVDLRLTEVGLVVDDLSVDAPLVSLHVQQAAARATGRLVAATDLGVVFSGGVVVDAVLDDAIVNAGPVVARGAGSAHVVVVDVATGPQGLEVLRLSGGLDLSLRSGRVPLFTSSLEVLPGASASIQLTKVELGSMAPARVEGSVDVSAESADCVVEPTLLTVPGSACRLAVGRFVVAGPLLVAEKLHASVKTR